MPGTTDKHAISSTPPSDLPAGRIGELIHKLKGPLTTLNLYSEALLSGNTGELNDEQRDYIQEMHKASKKMVSHVNELKELVKK